VSAATTQVNTIGRGPNVYGDVSVASISITGVSTTYTTATGGLPFDLTTVLQTIGAGAIPSGQAPNYTQTQNPNDIVGVIPYQMSTNGFLPLNFALGTPTYTAIPWQSDNGVAATPGALATCPCTIRLWGTGSGNALAFAEVGNGANSDSFNVLLYINRNGANS
jgi:hypothetical protein